MRRRSSSSRRSSACQEYGTTVADAKVIRDEAIAEAYVTFAKAAAAAGE